MKTKRARINRRHLRIKAISQVEQLENRQLMTGSGVSNVFGLYDGAIPEANASDRIDFSISSTDFSFVNGRIVLGFETVARDGSSLDPAAVEVHATSDGSILTPRYSNADALGGSAGVALVQLSANTSYYLTVRGQDGTSGAYQVQSFLVGDVNGDRRVDDSDGQSILAGITNHTYQRGADANLDNLITATDYAQWRANLNASTRLNPLDLTADVTPGLVTLPGGTLATNQPSVHIVGTTGANASVAVETGADDAYDEGSTAADGGTGVFDVSGVALSEGTNNVKLRSRSAQSFVQQRLATLPPIALDTHAPNLTVQPLSSDVAATNVTIHGNVTDVGVAGVAVGGLEVRMDGGNFAPVTFDSTTGDFSLTTNLSLLGSADGTHNLHFRATDRVGNVTGEDAGNVSFTLDTRAPTLSITSPLNNGTIADGDHLTGTADGTGSSLATLTYRIDGGTAIALGFDAGTGAFDQALNLSGLAQGAHTLVVSATDRAGNSASTTLKLTLGTAVAPSFALTMATPANGSIDVGVTVRPQIFFSRPIDPSSLNSNNFYATFGGQKLAAVITPSNDGTFAWLFFSQPMPNASQIRVTVDGSTIHPLDDPTALLDAAGNGAPGSTLTFDFKTVSLVSAPNTSLSGYVVDPGPDLEPMTDDDLDMMDGTYLLPIANVKVFILGQEDQAVFTDAMGYYHLDSVPIGNVKVVINGLTAVNVPAGYYFPEMVMDATMKPGIENDLMQSMTTGDMSSMMDMPMIASAMTVGMGIMPMYQPRVESAILQTVSNASGMKITSDEHGAPQLTPEQQQMLTVDVAPNSLIGADGLPVASAQIGISVVPPETVMDMLPEGVLQHTFDITVQAMGATNFSTPAPMTFPNVFNSPPGTKLDFLSFDHTTGRLVIEGTATVSDDGLSVHTDPGVGVSHPGWHGLTPPGGCGGSGGPPPPPPPPPPPNSPPVEAAPVAFPMITSETGSFSIPSWTAPPKPPNTPPPPPPPPGCTTPTHDPNKDLKDPYIKVTIDVDGPLSDFMKKSGNLELKSQSFTLTAGSGETKTFGGTALDYNALFKGKWTDQDKDQLYGSKIKITEVTGKTDGSTTTKISTYYQYRWVTVIDPTEAHAKSGTTAAFQRTLTDGVIRQKDVAVHLPTGTTTKYDGPLFGSPFDLGGATSGTKTDTWKFDPFLSGPRSDTFDIQVNDPKNSSLKVGSITAKGTATNATKIDINLGGFKDELNRVITSLVRMDGPDGMPNTADDILRYTRADGNTIDAGARYKTEFAGFLPGDVYTPAQLAARINTEATLVQAAVEKDYNAVNTAGGAVGYTFGSFLADVTMNWQDHGTFGVGGEADYDSDEAYLRPIILDTTISEASKEYALAEALNKKVVNKGIFAISDHIGWTNAAISLAGKVANIVNHEIGHTFGLNDAYTTSGGVHSVNPMPDNMNAYSNADGDFSFGVNNTTLLEAALGFQPNGALSLKNALKMYRDNINLPGSTVGIVQIVDPSRSVPDLGVINAGEALSPGDTYTFTTVPADGAGGSSSTVDLVIANVGSAPLDLGSVALADGTMGFSIDTTDLAGVELAPGESHILTLRFDPSQAGHFHDTLVIQSNADVSPSFSIGLDGDALPNTPRASVVFTAGNNLGGVAVAGAGESAQRDEFATITNTGVQPLTISSIQLAEGIGRFSLLGVPADLAVNPIVLEVGQTFSFGIAFKPNHVGLDRAIIAISSNDPDHPVQKISAVGTGLDTVVYPHWGNDFIAVDTPDLPGSGTLRTVSDDDGNFSVFLPPDQFYEVTIYDPITGLVSHGFGTTPPSGQGTDLTANLVFLASTENDSDGDGLPDDIEHAIGTRPDSQDTNEDGIDDYTAIDEGIDALGEQGLPIGIIGTVRPQVSPQDGTPFVQDVVANATTAYLAAGPGGVQVVDFSRMTKPVVIASVPSSQLGGDALAVDFTSIPGATPGTFQNLVAAALGDHGLAVVDVTDPPAAHLLTTIPIPGSALSVQIVDNLAYVGGHGGLVSIVDMKTNEVLATFTATGTGDVNAVAFNAGTLYTLRGGTLASYDISANLANPPLLSSIQFPGANSLFVGTDRAYLSGQFVLAAVDISNPSNLVNTSGAFARQFYSGVAVNGSGRLVVGTSTSFGSNPDYAASLFDVTNPDDLNTFLTQFDTPGSVQNVWVQNGLALIADGGAGFAIFNYLPFDTGDSAPAITVRSSSPDGTTAVEGSRLRVDVDTLDDVQTRDVTLSYNGVTLVPDGSYPYSFFVDVPTLASGATTLSLLVTATDTGGNQSTSQLNLSIVADTVAPRLLSVVPADGKFQFNSLQSFRATFSEPLDTDTLTSGAGGSVRIIEAGADGAFGTADDVDVPIGSFDFRLSVNMLTVLPASPLGPGKYELVLDNSQITDRAGNAIGSGLFKSRVTVESIPFNAVISGNIANPGQVDLDSFYATAGGEVTLFANWNPDSSGLGGGRIALVGPDGVTILGSAEGDGSVELADIALPTTGLYTIQILASSAHPLAIGTYTFTISDPNPPTQTIAYGQALTSNIAVRGDDQKWQFDATAGDLVDFSYVGPLIQGGITIYNPDGTVASVLPGGSTIVQFATTFTQTGTYHFSIDDNDSTGTYTIRLDQGSFVDAVNGQFDTVQHGTITPLYNVDTYRYTLHAGDVTTIFADLGPMGGGTVRLLDAATGADLATPSSGTQVEFSRYTSDADRDVLVQITGATNPGFHSGNYILTASNPVQSTQTLTFGSQKNATILVRGDDQNWQFTANGGELVTIGYRGPNLDSGLVITKPDGTSTLVSLPAGSTLVARDLLLDQAGTYHFTLADPDATGAYILNLSNPQNPTPLGDLSANLPLGGTIGAIFQVNTYTFSATAGQAFSVLEEWSPGGTGLTNGEIDLYAPDGTLVGSAQGTTASSITVASAAAGVYKIRIRAASGDDFRTGAYRTTVYSGAESPTNDTLATATATGIQPGTTHAQTTGFIGDNIQGTKDVDIYILQAGRGDQIAAEVDALAGSDLNAFIRLFDSSGNLLASNDNFGQSLNALVSYTVLTTGTYYIGVSSNGNPGYDPTTAGSGSGGSVGGYQLTLDVAKDVTGPVVTSVTPSGTSTREDVTTIVVAFNERLNATTATEPTNYVLVSAGDDGILGTGDDSVIPVTPSYDTASHVVTLTLDSALPRGFTYQLTIKGTGDMPVSDIAGNALNDGVDATRSLELVTSVATPTSFPLNEGFETGSLGDYWTTSTTGGAAVTVATGAGGAHGGSNYLLLSTNGSAGRATAVLSIDLSGLTPDAEADLSFYHRDADYNESMSAPFAGRIDADGVAVSVDGVNWFPVVDLGATSDGGYTRYIADLKGTLLSNGIPFPPSSPVQVMFQHFLYGGQTASFDDIRIDTDLSGPTITAISTPGPLVFSNSLNSILINFSKHLDSLGANSASSYQLLNNGSVVALSAHYDDNAQAVTLTTSAVLQPGSYTLRVRGNPAVGGTTQIRDVHGNLLNNGADSNYSFILFALESPSNDEIDTATNTGISAGGNYSITTAIGNNDNAAKDVDLYKFVGHAGDRINASTYSQGYGAAGLNTLLRLFDATGTMLASNDNRDPFSTDSQISGFELMADGIYYLGVSSSNNSTYNPNIAPSGRVGTQGEYQLSLGVTTDVTAPTVTHVVPHVGPNVKQSISTVQITFSEPVVGSLAGDQANYSLTYLGADGVLGGGDDQTFSFTASYVPSTLTTTLSLNAPGGLLPLPIGAYQLVARGTAGHIADLAGNRLNGGVDYVQLFNVIPPESPLNDRFADAIDTGLPFNGGSYTASGAIGDNAFGAKDVDLYRVLISGGLRVTVTLNDYSLDSPLSVRIRLFDSAGNELAASESSSSDDTLSYDVANDGTYYVGVSGSGNYYYNPFSPGSGADASTTGEYVLKVVTQDVVAPVATDFTPSLISVGNTLSQVSVQFSKPMDLQGASSPASYSLTSSGPDRVFGTADDVSLPFSVVYNLNTHIATLTTNAPIPNGNVRLVLHAATLTDRPGLHLNGGTDSSYTFAVASQGASPPFADGFEAGTFGPNWITLQADPNGSAVITGAGGPRQAAKHLELVNLNTNYFQYTTSTAILAVDAAHTTDLNLSFYAKRGQYEWQFALPASFTGNGFGDGVAISVDGQNWFRVVDLSTQGGTSYDRFTADLTAAATAAGLSLDGVLLIRFSNSEYYSSGTDYARFFDDVRITDGAAPPVIASLVPGTFVTAANPTSFGVTFTASVTTASAQDTTHYQLVRAGADGLLGTADDVTVPLASASYNDATHTVTLTAASTLVDDEYRITVLPTVVDPNGVPFNDGLPQSADLDVSATETTTDDTLATAVSTGLTGSADGTFVRNTSIGNNAFAGRDVDLYAIEGVTGERLAVHLSRLGVNDANLRIRIFDASGTELTTAATDSTSQANLTLLLNSNQAYYVGISSSANSAYNPAVAGSGVDSGVGLYRLSIETNNGVAVPPLFDGFEDATLAPYFTTYSSNGNSLVQPTTFPKTGAQSLLLGYSVSGYNLSEATLTFDATVLAHNDLSFSAYSYAYYYYINSFPLNPAGGTFTGHYNGNGVSFSVDGTTWHTLVDFGAAYSGGEFPAYTWTPFTVDLQAAAAAAGVPLNDHTQIRFQAYTYGFGVSQSDRLYIDDLKIGEDLVPPTVVSATGSDTFVIQSDLTAPTVTFSESMDAASANNAANYQFTGAGADGAFGTGDDVTYTVTPSYDDATLTTTLALSGVVTGLPTGQLYRLRIVGTGASPLADLAGNALAAGADVTYTFLLAAPESPTNNTLATATATGVTSVGGGYKTKGMLGDDGTDGLATYNDVDLYQFQANAGQTLYADAYSRFGDPDLRLRLFDSAGNQITFLDQGDRNAQLDHFTITVDGTYYLGVSASDDSGYDPVNGGGDTGTTRGVYDLSIQIINPAGFPFFDGFESGAFNLAYWDVYTYSNGPTQGDARVEGTTPAPIDGNYSAVLSQSGAINYAYAQTDLTLHLDLTGRTNAELRFKAQNNYDYNYGFSYPVSYNGRYNGTDGVFLSVDGVTFYRIPNIFQDGPGTGVKAYVADLDEFAALNGLTLGPDTEIRFSTYSYAYDSSHLGRSIDDVQVLLDETGPVVKTVTTDNNSTATTLLNDALTTFKLTFDDRLAAATATDAAAYRLVFAGADGKFAGQAGDTGDDRTIALNPSYDGNFGVTLGVDSGALPLAPGLYRLIVKGTGADVVTDADGNVLNGGPGLAAGSDAQFSYTLVPDGPRVLSSTPTGNGTVSPATGFSTVNLVFNTPIDPNSFDGTDVRITNSNGTVVVDPSTITVAPTGGDATGTLWTISFPTIHELGQYTVQVGPAVTDLSGNAMNQNGDTVNGQGFSDAFRVTVTVTDVGSTRLLDQDGFRYDINPQYGYINDGGRIDPVSGNQTAGDSYDGYGYLQVGANQYFNSANAYALTNSGQTIVLPTIQMSGLNVHREIYVPSSGGDFARYLEVLNNPGASAITTTVTFSGNLGSDSSTIVTADSDGNLIFTTADNYLATDDSNNGGGDLSLGHVIQDGNGAVVTSSASRNGDQLTWTFTVTVPAGKTVRIMTLETQQLNNAAAAAQAANLVGLPGGVLANLTDAEIGSILNFHTGQDTIAPTLASITPDSSVIQINPVYQFVATFSERLDPATANDAANYTLVGAGPDNSFGTDDDTTISLTPTYDDASHAVTLDVDPGVAPLPGGLYRLTFSQAITDRAGNPLNGGADRVVDYNVFASGPVVTSFYADDTTATDGFSHFAVSFDRPIDPSTFGGDDVIIVNAYTGVTVDQANISVTDQDGQGLNWIVSFPTIFDPAGYSITIGPHIADFAAHEMNEDGDDVNGGDNDSYTTSVIVTDTGSTTLVDDAGFLYDVDPFYGELQSGGRTQPEIGQTDFDSYSYLGYLQVDGSFYSNDDNAYAIRDGGQTLVLPTIQTGNLLVSREITVPASGGRYARYLEVLTNPSSSQVQVDLRISGNVGSAYQIYVTDSDGNGSFNPGDTYFVNGGGTLGLAHVLMDGNTATINTTTQGATEYDWTYPLTIGPGETVRILRFEIQQPDTDSATTAAVNLLNPVSAGALDDLSDEVKGTIVNFATGFDSIGPYITNDLTFPRFTDDGPVGALYVYFSESLDAATGNDPNNYGLVEAGPDGLFGTADDVAYGLTPFYSDYGSGSLVYLGVYDLDSGDPVNLPTGLYKVDVRAAITDVAGNALNGGIDNGYIFNVLENGPRVVGFTPNSTDARVGFSSFTVRFSKPIDPASFDGSEVSIFNPATGQFVDNSLITVAAGPNDATGTVWVVSFPAITNSTSVHVTVGPNITDLHGDPMNQFQDGYLGQSNDSFTTNVFLTFTLQDGGGFQYDLNVNDGSLSGGGYLDPDTNTRVRNGSYAGFPWLFISGGSGSAQYNSNGFYTEEDGGQTVVLGTESIGDLDVHRETHVPTDDQFIRFIDVLTNSTDSAITTTIYEYGYLGPNETQVVADSSGNGAFDATDTYFVSDDGDPTGGSLSLGHVITDGTLQPSVIYIDGNYHYQAFTVTIQPGQTIRVMTLETQQLNAAAAVAQAQALIALPASVYADLTDEERASVINFSLPSGGGPAAQTLSADPGDGVLNTAQFVAAATDGDAPSASMDAEDARTQAVDFVLDEWAQPATSPEVTFDPLAIDQLFSDNDDDEPVLRRVAPGRSRG